MNNTATKENIETPELSRYEIDQPIAALLGDLAMVDLFSNKGAKEKTEKMAENAIIYIEIWSRAISFLIWKASTADDCCKQTVSSMGDAADSLACFATMIQPLSDLKDIKDLGKKAESLKGVQSENTKTDTSRDTLRETNGKIKAELAVMLDELEAIASTSMHRVMDGIENENPVSTDTLIGLFSGIVRQTKSIQSEVDKIQIS